MSDPVSVIKAGKEILGVLVPFAQSARSRRARKKAGEICAALRAIYFDDPGVLPVLKQIAAGKKVDRSQFDRAIFHFFQGEWDVQRALGALEHEKTFDDLRFTIKTIRTMDRVRNDKGGIRRMIQDQFPSYKSRFSEKERRLAKQLVKAIGGLNKSIEDLDAALNVAAIERQ